MTIKDKNTLNLILPTLLEEIENHISTLIESTHYTPDLIKENDVFYTIDGYKIKEWIARETKKIELGSTKIKASEKYKTKDEFKDKITEVWGFQIITNPSDLKSHYERLMQSLSLDFIDDFFLNKEIFYNYVRR